jgi:hypothetical protein
MDFAFSKAKCDYKGSKRHNKPTLCKIQPTGVITNLDYINLDLQECKKTLIFKLDFEK